MKGEISFSFYSLFFSLKGPLSPTVCVCIGCDHGDVEDGAQSQFPSFKLAALHLKVTSCLS